MNPLKNILAQVHAHNKYKETNSMWSSRDAEDKAERLRKKKYPFFSYVFKKGEVFKL
jgi:hypothetical protein